MKPFEVSVLAAKIADMLSRHPADLSIPADCRAELSPPGAVDSADPPWVVHRHMLQIPHSAPQRSLAVSLGVLAVVATGIMFYVARAYVMPVTTAFVFAVVLSPVCRKLESIRIPASIAALAAMLLATGAVYGGFALIAEPAARWIDDAPHALHRAEEQISKLRRPLKTVQDLSHEVESLSIVPAAPQARTVVVQGPELTQSLIASAQVIIVQAIFILVLTYFFLLTRHEVRLKFIAFQRHQCDRVRTARAFRDVERGVGGYFVVFTLINLAAGVMVGLACWGLGLPDPVMWGGLAALLNFIPYVGPAITIAFLALAGLSTFDTLLQAAYPVAAYVAISFLESNFLTPTIMSRRMTLNPLAIMLAVSFWTWIWGPVGALISLPLLIMLKVVADHTPSLRPLGALLGGKLRRPARLATQVAAAG